MVLRKPYAFLIKNFKKIHILLLAICGYVYYRIFILMKFIKEFILFNTYNKNLEGINTKINGSLYLSIILILLITLAIMGLLIYKKKPWKLYLIIIANYIVMIYGLISVANFFNTFSLTDPTSGILLPRDIVRITSIIQYVVFLIIIMRITGLDLKKFQFNTDQEFLELSNKDKEEFEVNIEFDKNSIKRLHNRLKRNIDYVYQEHKFIINTLVILIVIGIIGYNYYYFGIKHKKYNQGQVYTVGSYSIKIGDVYITDKDAIGNEIEKDCKFVLVKVKVKNISDEKIEPNFKRYHLMNKNVNTVHTIYYDDSFTDVGKGISKESALLPDEEKEFLIVYKVKKDLENDKFVLYFQEYNGENNTYLRKIKFKYQDISKITSTKKYEKDEKIEIEPLNGQKDEITFDDIAIEDETVYSRYICITTNRCEIQNVNLRANANQKILRISFSSSDYEGKEFIDFTSRYGIIKYVDNENKEHDLEIENSISTDYEGKEIYINVPNEVVTAKDIYIDYKVRNTEYIVRIK